MAKAKRNIGREILDDLRQIECIQCYVGGR
jgi:hypothetical protein